MISYKEQIEAVAPYANLNQRASAIIQHFFLEIATQEEKDELDEWLNESEANERLFDLLISATRGGVGAGIIKLINDHTKKEPKKRSRSGKIFRIAGIGLLIILAIDQLVPLTPLRHWMQQVDGIDKVNKIEEASGESRIIKLSDGTRVELHPHSKLGYSTKWYWYDRKVWLWGSASFEIAASKDGPFKVKSGKMSIELPEGPVTVLGDSVNPVVFHSNQ
ncbi:FecR domain-containing protein [Flavihumibacter profundi]|uniref:FecR domain-containing protein n=1 Tax=Flavihumibacter profundi TaxID=2716883 RepID=UPI001CC69871|nr:FecR domain-containing protein [Flavihumibacter profundi]MBZ5857586.1 FecR domain-containing protein [Flavihumibacter profundi]